MNTYQQRKTLEMIHEEKDETTTEAETFIAEEDPSLISQLVNSLPFVAKEFDRHHAISAKMSQGTFTSDKILKLLSAVLKTSRTFNLSHNLKGLEKFSYQIGQLRRLLRYDRTLMILKEFTSFQRKAKLSKLDKFMVLFKSMILFGDLNDMLGYFVQLNIIPGDKALPILKKNVANIYFLECLGWLIYHLYEYNRSRSEEEKNKNKVMIIKYILDTFTSHNDFTQRLFTTNPKLITLVGLLSSCLNLYMAWK